MWTYSQSSGKMTDSKGAVLAIGYSGNGPDLNRAESQSIQMHGPLPQGLYTIEAPQNSPHTGPYTLDLTPDASNEMFGRSLFRIHGAPINGPLHSGSDGCIIMPRFARERIWESGDHQLTVVA
jgi:hypothetical protein